MVQNQQKSIVKQYVNLFLPKQGSHKSIKPILKRSGAMGYIAHLAKVITDY